MIMHASSETNVARVQPHAYPLDEFYLAAGLPLPRIDLVSGEQVPEPYRTLLVHERDMTPTLEKFHGSPVHLQVLRSQVRGDSYFREVVLRLETGEVAVEFGAIKINLALFTPPARRLILEERWPLGHILKDCEIPHCSRPKGYLRIRSDTLINQALGLEKSRTLYGRRNTLTDLQHRPLAEIVELMPPTPSNNSGRKNNSQKS